MRQAELRARARRLALAIGTVLACVVLPLQPIAPAAAQTAPLLNETFEGAFQNDAAGGGDCGQNTCQTPAGWGVWFTRRTDTDAPGINFQPKYEQTRAANRFKSGAAALRYYTTQATHTGGVYRIVANVAPGSRLKLSGFGQSWSTNDESPISARPSRDVRLKIGLDPLGGEGGKANPFSPQIVWSPEQSAADGFKEFTVEAEAKAATVIVYLYSTMKDSVRHNEVFWDDVTLTLASPEATPTAEGGAPAATPEAVAATPTVAPTAAPVLTDDVKVTVKQGETLLGIAVDNGITLEQLRQLNPDVNPQTLQIGQELIIKKGNAIATAPAAGATATPAPGEQPGIGVTTTITGTPTVGGVCVQAFFDDDGDGERAERGEDLVPQILFSLTRDGAPIGDYTSTGVDEPYCFDNLANGDYIVAATVLQIYQPSTPISDQLNVRGARSYFSIGIRRRADAALNVSATSTPTSRPSVLSAGNVLSVLAIIGGLLMIVGLLGFLASAFLRRRRL